jgi:glycosyltransferase involved in cell wall biosynthesis
MDPSLVSVIMAAGNESAVIGEAIRSVLAQSWPHWELIVVVNGSSDDTAAIVQSFGDPRIICEELEEAGLGRARNHGIRISQGAFICFLDADDRLPDRSLEARVRLMSESPDLMFADGVVLSFDESFRHVTRRWVPGFRGVPDREMARLNPECFCGITWMIRKTDGVTMHFDPSWSHLEDRIFFLSLAPAGKYGFADEEVYHIRRRRGSLMSDHGRMEAAYRRFLLDPRVQGVQTEEERRSEWRYFHRMFFRISLRRLDLPGAARHLWTLCRPSGA